MGIATTAALAWLCATGAVVAETVHGVVVYSRHGDRSTKHYGAQALTNLGAAQNFEIGSAYRARYLASSSPKKILGISENTYVSSQVAASAPNQGILQNTAVSFLQGLYPPQPIASVQALNNGSQSVAPLSGYQYVLLTGESLDAPSSIWIKGRDQCTTALDATKDFAQSSEFKAVTTATKDFYKRFFNVLQWVYDYTSPDQMSYAKAYDIFDLINVARIHNASSPAQNVSDADLFQLRTLADSAEFGSNFNASQPARSLHGKTLVGGILNQLNQIVSTKGKLKFSLMAGSYDAFLAFFGITNLPAASPDFYGMPDYASTMAFELFTPTDRTAFPADPNVDLRVRFLFRNSTYGQLTAFPLFGTGQDSLAWPDFVAQMQSRAISSPKEYCSVCNSKAVFCANYRDVAAPDASTATITSNGGGMSNAVAGVIGAMVTLAVTIVAGAVAFVILRRKRAQGVAEKAVNDSRSSISSKA